MIQFQIFSEIDSDLKMNVYQTEYDDVIKGIVAIGSITYCDAIDNLIPLINKTDFQRKLQPTKFYSKLKSDLIKGCVVPPITVAFVTDKINKNNKSIDSIENYIKNNFKSAFVLDGIQRLNTLHSIHQEIKQPYLDKLPANNCEETSFNSDKTLFVNYIFSDSYDRLLYRMITLNNGQKPMTLRHQVEAIMSNLKLCEKFKIITYTEKEGINKNNKLPSFKESFIIEAYIAYMANDPNINNKKIIEESMDALLVNKIELPWNIIRENSFSDVLKIIEKYQFQKNVFEWLNVINNLVGFSVGIRHNPFGFENISSELFSEKIDVFETAFSKFNPSKIKVGKLRRRCSFEFIKKFDKFINYNDLQLLDFFSEITDE